jgi:hypothetical protein
MVVTVANWQEVALKIRFDCMRIDTETETELQPVDVSILTFL